MNEHTYTATREAGQESLADNRSPLDLREWISRAEAIGQVQRIAAPVDPDEEMGAITYMAHQTIGAPALLFEEIKDYQGDARVLFNPIGSSRDRLALAVGLPTGLSSLELIRQMGTRIRTRIPPVMVAPEAAPIYEHHQFGEEIDLTRLPIPKHWPLDGGPYAGTCDSVITRDPEQGWLNMGTYRMMIHDRNHVGLMLSPGKDARLHIERAWQRNEPLEVVAVWGTLPALYIAGSQTFPKTQSELDYAGGLLGRPLELVPGICTSLPIPAYSEIAIEGIIRPGALKLEGPFGEFTGYYGRPEDDAFLVEVLAVHHRSRPIMTHALMADYPACDCSLLYSVARAARVWDDLDRLGVPGIRGVYSHPAAAGGVAMTIISLEQRYAGHAAQALALAAQCPGGAYFSKWIVAVDDDVDPCDINQVLWAMATRCNPSSDIDILRNTWSTWLDPTKNPPAERPYGSKALINACKEHRYLNTFSRRSKVRRSMYDQIQARWRELGFTAPPPSLTALEEE